MSGGEMITISLEDIKMLERLAVVESGHDILVKDFQATRHATDENISKIFELLRAFPKQVSDCSNDLEIKIHKDLEKHYATDTDVKALRVDMTNKIDNIGKRFKWTTGLIVVFAGTIQFFMTMYFLSLQIQKLTVLG